MNRGYEIFSLFAIKLIKIAPNIDYFSGNKIIAIFRLSSRFSVDQLHNTSRFRDKVEIANRKLAAVELGVDYIELLIGEFVVDDFLELLVNVDKVGRLLDRLRADPREPIVDEKRSGWEQVYELFVVVERQKIQVQMTNRLDGELHPRCSEHYVVALVVELHVVDLSIANERLRGDLYQLVLHLHQLQPEDIEQPPVAYRDQILVASAELHNHDVFKFRELPDQLARDC